MALPMVPIVFKRQRMFAARCRQAGDPHLGRAEGVHPGNQPNAVVVRVGIAAHGIDFVGRFHRWLPDDVDRDGGIGMKRFGDLF